MSDESQREVDARETVYELAEYEILRAHAQETRSARKDAFAKIKEDNALFILDYKKFVDASISAARTYKNAVEESYKNLERKLLSGRGKDDVKRFYDEYYDEISAALVICKTGLDASKKNFERPEAVYQAAEMEYNAACAAEKAAKAAYIAAREAVDRSARHIQKN